MPVFQTQLTVPAPIERVWDWYLDVRTALTTLSPPEDQVELESAPVLASLGADVIIRAKGPFGRLRWHARYTDFAPPHPVAFGVEARFVDEQVSGPFATWKHCHEFDAADSRSTVISDYITYRPPLYPLSYPAEVLLIRPKLRRMFAHRHEVLRRIFA
jgi:uncharacterized protein